MLTEKPKLTLVYIDGAGVTGQPPRTFGPITPARLKPIIDDLSNGTAMKRIFVDDLATGCTNPETPLNVSINRWHLGGYEAVYCPRVGTMGKESIDFILIEKVHEDLRLFGETHQLHFVLIVGDADYRPLITKLLDLCTVSVILTRPNAIMKWSLLHRLHRSIFLFEKTNASKAEPSVHRTARAILNGSPANMQGAYAPGPQAFSRLRSFFDISMVTCPHCGQTFPIGHLSSHYCEDVIPRNPPSGIATVHHIEHLSMELSRLPPEDLISRLINYQRAQVLPDVLNVVIEHMPIISWQIANLMGVLQQIKSAGKQGIQKPDLDLGILIRQGIIMPDGRWVRINTTHPSIERLAEEVSQRTFYPLTAALFSPDGAVNEDRLRSLVISSIRNPPHIADPPQNPDPENLWGSDDALGWLTHPNLNPDTRMEILSSTDEVHTLQYWSQLLPEITDSTSSDLITTTENIANLAARTHFLTLNSIGILVANGLLVFEEVSQALFLNRKHPFFHQGPLSQRAVA